MNILLDEKLAREYNSNSQITRVLTESWIAANMYCPVCGWDSLVKFPNNKPVADFYCPHCGSEYELKSKNGKFGKKIACSSYDIFIQRITSADNPHFLIMSYSREKMKINSLYFVPNFFFVPTIVEKRKPLTKAARRSGWVGCSILFDQIPVQGRIPIIQNSIIMNKDTVIRQAEKLQGIKTDDISARSWLMDILSCVNRIESNEFTLKMVYDFEQELAFKHPDNNNIRAKIRQQLQELRDRGVITFLGNGKYIKI